MRVSGIVGSLREGLVSGREDWIGGSSMLLERILSEEGLVGKGFSSSGLLDSIIATSAVLTVREVRFRANSAFEMGASPVLGLDFFHRFSSLNALVTGLIVFSFQMFPTSTESADR